MNSTSDIKSWIDILQALLTPVIALAGAAIAIAQWRINKARLRHELFEKRYAIYRTASDYLTSIVRSGKPLLEEQDKYIKGIQGAKFIFDDDVSSILDDIWEQSIDLECVQFELQDIPVGTERSQKCCEAREIKRRLRHTLDPLTNSCKKYLQLNHR